MLLCIIYCIIYCILNKFQLSRPLLTEGLYTNLFFYNIHQYKLSCLIQFYGDKYLHIYIYYLSCKTYPCLINHSYIPDPYQKADDHTTRRAGFMHRWLN